MSLSSQNTAVFYKKYINEVPDRKSIILFWYTLHRKTVKSSLVHLSIYSGRETRGDTTMCPISIHSNLLNHATFTSSSVDDDFIWIFFKDPIGYDIINHCSTLDIKDIII